MSNQPIIGINADFRAAARSTPAYSYIAAGYFQSISAAGGIPLIMPPLDDPDAIARVVDQVHRRKSRVDGAVRLALALLHVLDGSLELFLFLLL